MQLQGSTIIEVCILVYILAIVAEILIRRNLGRFMVQLAVLSAVVVLALLLNNATDAKVAFGGGVPSVGATAIIFASIILGVIARYVFYLEGKFSWLGLLKPMCITPVVLLPLWGTVQGTDRLNTTQMVYFALLAFQNGFFWPAVLDKAKPKTQ